MARGRELAFREAAGFQAGEPQAGQGAHRRQQDAARLAQNRRRRLQASQQPIDERREGNRSLLQVVQRVARGGDVVEVTAERIDLVDEPRVTAYRGMDERRPAEQGRVHLPGMPADRSGRRFQERVQVRQRAGQAARLHAGQGRFALAAAARGACRVRWCLPARRLELRQAVERCPSGPQVVRPAQAGDAGHLRRVEAPAAAVDEAAAQHRDQVSQPPSLRGQPQQPPHPDAERAVGERLAGHRVERQVVLGEHLPRQAEDSTGPAKRHSAIRWTQAAVVGQPALDGARHAAQLSFAVGGNAPLQRGRRRVSGDAFDRRVREQAAQALMRVGSALAGVGIERQQQIAVAAERGQQAQLAAMEESEAVGDHQGGQRGRVSDSRGRARKRGRSKPPVGLQSRAVGAVYGCDRRELRVARAAGRGRESLRRDVLGQQLFDRRPQHRQRGGRPQRCEVGGGAGLDLPVRDGAEQFARGPDRGGPQPGVEPAGEAARGFHLQVERHPASRQQPPAELVAVPDGGHHHQRRGKRVRAVPLRGSPEERLGLPGPGRPDYEGGSCDALHRTVGAARESHPDKCALVCSAAGSPHGQIDRE